MDNVDNLKVHFQVSPFLNLYYSLEVATGTVIEEYNEEYAKRMNEVFPERILKEFKELHDRQRFSWNIKSCLYKRTSDNKINDAMLSLASRFKCLLDDAFFHYKAYWNKVGPSLTKARELLEENRNECQKLLAMVSDMLHMPWRIGELNVQLVDPFTGEPIGEDTVCFGVGPIAAISPEYLTAISYFFILHEATHILVWDGIRKVAEKHTTEEHAEYIDEAVMNLVSYSILGREERFRERFQKAMEIADKLKFPPTSYIGEPKTPEGEIYKARHEKRNHYIEYYRRLFQEHWEELLASGMAFPYVVTNLLKGNAEKIKSK